MMMMIIIIIVIKVIIIIIIEKKEDNKKKKMQEIIVNNVLNCMYNSNRLLSACFLPPYVFFLLALSIKEATNAI